MKRYSLLSLLLEDNKFLRINMNKIYPNAFERSQVCAVFQFKNCLFFKDILSSM